MESPVLRKLSKKKTIGLVYVAISFLTAAWAVQMVQSQVRWFAEVNQLTPEVRSVIFRFNSQLTSGFALLDESLENPSDFGGVKVSEVDYKISVKDFSVQGSSEVAMFGDNFEKAIPAKGILNLASNITIFPDLVGQLANFINNQGSDLRVFVEITPNLYSTFGLVSLQYCYETLEGLVASCP